jgi:hypothetical protein
MDRVIYCPSSEFLEEASSLARKTYLQIIVGDNDHTADLDFDRGKVLVVSVPQNKGYFFLKSVKEGFHQNIKYKNEFCVIKNKVNLFINNDLIKPVYEESHVAKFIHLCKDVGDYSCRIVVDQKIEEEFSFVVN